MGCPNGQEFLRFNLPDVPEKAGLIAQVMGLTDPSADAVIADLEARLEALNIPKSLHDIGVPADCAQRIAEKAIQDSAAETNPRSASVDQIKALTERAIRQAR